MLITKQTLPIVLGFIKKITKKHPIINSQLDYPAYKRTNNKRRKLGINIYPIEQSNIHSFEVKEAQIHNVSWHEPYININNQGEDIDYDNDDFMMDNYNNSWKATVINIGQDVTFKNNTLIIKQQHPTDKRMIAIEKIWFTKSL